MTSSEHSFVSGGGPALHQGGTMRSQLVPTESEQQAQAAERVNDPQHAAGLAAAMAKARRYADEITYREHHGAVPQRSPLEAAERDELAAIADQQARAAQPAATPPAAGGQQTPAPATTGDADLDARLDELVGGLHDRLGTPAPPPPQPGTHASLDALVGPPGAAAAAQPDRPGVGPDRIEAKRQAAIDLAKAYSANTGGAIR